MLRLLRRLLWLCGMLLGVSFATFAVVDLAPVDRAELAIARAAGDRAFADLDARERAILQLRAQFGMVDPVTLQPAPLGTRYLQWLGNAARLRFAGPNGDHDALWRRIAQAWPTTALLGGLALLLAFGVGVPLGARLGMAAGTAREGVASALLLAFAALPEFLVATLLLLAFGAAGLQWLPVSGLRSPDATTWPAWQQALDSARHLVLPVAVIGVGPLALVARFVRDAVARADRSPWVETMRALGAEPAVLRRRLRRHGALPAATLAGSLLPMLVGGSVVAENAFALDGLGHLAFTAASEQDQPLLLALVTLGAIATLLAFAFADWLHARLDRRAGAA
ncbi:MAG: ABC transporter permease [Planctomycetes bacterium]|nr:ABC transporter permease [Planctomycetota bacterium]